MDDRPGLFSANECDRRNIGRARRGRFEIQALPVFAGPHRDADLDRTAALALHFHVQLALPVSKKAEDVASARTVIILLQGIFRVDRDRVVLRIAVIVAEGDVQTVNPLGQVRPGQLGRSCGRPD